MKDFFKKVWGWLTSSNHLIHIILSMAVAMASLVPNAFFLPSFKLAILSSAVTVLFVGIAIECYQVFLAKELTVSSVKNTIGDLFCDVIGGVIGVLVFWLCMNTSPTSAIVCYVVAALLWISWFFVIKNEKLKKYKDLVLLAFLFIGLFGFGMLLFA